MLVGNGLSLQDFNLPIPDPLFNEWRLNRRYELNPEDHEEIADVMVAELNAEQRVLNI